MRINRLLAVSATLAIATLGTSGVAASADNGNGHAEGLGKSHAHSHVHSQREGHGQGRSDDSAGRSAHRGKGGNHGNSGNAAPGGNGQGHAYGHAKHANQGKAGSNGAGNGGNNAGGSHGNSGGNGGSAGDPAGNNGTVKIAPLGDFDGIPNNTPHVGCSFLVEWYGYDEGADIISTVTFAMKAPTSDVGLSVDGPSQVFVGGDPASGAGTDSGLDGRQQYTLSFDGAPHPKQGYHVKLTVNTPYSHGSDKKSKVFWVSGCEETPVTETPGGTGGTGDTGDTQTGGDTETSGDTSGTDTQLAGEQASTGSNDTQVAGQQASTGTRPAAGRNATLPTQVNAGGDVLDFVTSPLPLMMVALGLALGAIGLSRRSRRV